MKRINTILIGFGNVGRGFLQVLNEKREFCQAQYGLDIQVNSIFRREGALHSPQPLNPGEILEKYSPPSLFRGNPYWKAGLNLSDALESIEPGVVVACTPSSIRGGEPGLGYIRCALERGWHVATADKGPLVVEFRSLREKARHNHLALKFSGAAAAALPALDVALYSLAGAEIYRAEGILNGTTNYILTRMKEGADYQLALEEARSKGIAEPDPSFDVEGYDTAAKILIISNAVLNSDFSLNEVEVEGITRIPPRLLDKAREEGRALKLLGKIHRAGEDYRLEVSLTLIDSSHPLFGVDGTDKGITFFTDTMSSVTVKGGKSDPRGAGASLLKDVINIYRESCF
jgi:homoserine dehydrogenase